MEFRYRQVPPENFPENTRHAGRQKLLFWQQAYKLKK